jgi:hypothetical protein
MKEQKCAYCDAKAINQCAECKKPICTIHTVIDVDRHFARVCFRCAMKRQGTGGKGQGMVKR